MTNVEDAIKDVLDRIPTGPRAATGLDAQGNMIVSPFSSEILADATKIHLPGNWQSVKDDPLLACFLAAAQKVAPREILADAADVAASDLLEAQNQSTDRKLYFRGVLDAFKAGPNMCYNKDITGHYGRGYNWVAHLALQQTRVPPECIRGKTYTPSDILKGVVWKRGNESHRLRLLSFLSKVAKSIQLSKPSSYFKVKDELRGISIKQSLPWETRGGILSDFEREALSHKFANPITNYTKACDRFKPDKVEAMSPDDYRKAHTSLIEASGELKPVISHYEKVARLRFEALERDIPKGKLKKERAKKMAERLEEMDIDAYISVFHPAFVLEQRNLNLRTQGTRADPKFGTVTTAWEFIKDEFEPSFTDHWSADMLTEVKKWLDALYLKRTPTHYNS